MAAAAAKITLEPLTENYVADAVSRLGRRAAVIGRTRGTPERSLAVPGRGVQRGWYRGL